MFGKASSLPPHWDLNPSNHISSIYSIYVPQYPILRKVGDSPVHIAPSKVEVPHPNLISMVTGGVPPSVDSPPFM